MSGLIGKCPKCRDRYWGWALTNPPRQKCARCGSRLEIMANGTAIRMVNTRSTTSGKMGAE